MRTSRRSGMFETAIPPAPCGSIVGIDPKMPDVAFGIARLDRRHLEARSARRLSSSLARAALARPMPETGPQTTRHQRVVFIRSILLSYACEGAAAEVARRQRAFHRILAVDRRRCISARSACPARRGDEELDRLTFDGAGETRLRPINCDEYWPVSFSPSCLNVSVGLLLPAADSTVKIHDAGHVYFARLAGATASSRRRRQDVATSAVNQRDVCSSSAVENYRPFSRPRRDGKNCVLGACQEFRFLRLSA